MHRIVIVNTSPLFYLHRLGYLNVLEKLYGEIVVPDAVVAELEEGEMVGKDVPIVSGYNWIKVKKAAYLHLLKWSLILDGVKLRF